VTTIPIDDQLFKLLPHPHLLGVKMRQAVALGMAEAIARRDDLIVTSNASPGRLDDVFSDADIAAQRAIVDRVRNFAPWGKLLGEEADPNTPDLTNIPKGIRGFCWAIDPIDGTKNYIRGQLDGVASQLALLYVYDDGTYKIIAVYVALLASGDIIGFDPWSGGLQRYNHRGHLLTPLSGVDTAKPVHGSTILCRGNPFGYQDHDLLVRLLTPIERGGLARKLIAQDGSLTAFAARLLLGGATALVIPPREAITMPWDQAPLVGLLQAAGLISHSVDGWEIGPGDPHLISGFHRRNPVFWCRPEHLSEITNQSL
jgi:fructose-1,6-bisphosphatase/inositol monophosphatase family enzyme